MKTPRISRAALKGLTRAIGFILADDTSDDTDEQAAELQAADEWITRVWQANPTAADAE